ncbi:MAG: hypothetical protein WCS99_21575 [Limisphaerales bacterium]
MTPKLPIKGWKALLTLVSAVAATLLYGINWPQDGLAERFKQPVLRYLQAEQERRITAAFAPNGADKLSREELQKLAAASEAARNITIHSITVRGTLMQAVAEVDFRVDGKTPPDGREVRYLLLRQSGFGDWHVDRGTTVKSYYFAF